MKKILMIALGLLFACAPALCEEDPLAPPHRYLKDEAFVVETGDSDVSDSLNRIAGNIDLGFATPEQSFDSADHYRPGPFGRQDTQDKAQSY